MGGKRIGAGKMDRFRPITVIIRFAFFFPDSTPGKLPTCWLAPVRLLKIVVLPELGLPARATTISFLGGVIFLYLDPISHASAYGQFGLADLNLNRTMAGVD